MKIQRLDNPTVNLNLHVINDETLSYHDKGVYAFICSKHPSYDFEDYYEGDSTFRQSATRMLELGYIRIFK